MKNYREAIKNYKNLESKIHVNIDDVINKVTQEVAEIVEAHMDGDINETRKEAGDSLVNILSVADELGITPNFVNDEEYSQNNYGQLMVNLGNWNSDVAGYRNKYSRDDICLDQVTKSTNKLIGNVMSYIDSDLDASDILDNNSEKLSSRIDAYKKDIEIKDYIIDHNNFPKEGIVFKDISPLLKDKDALEYVTYELAEKCRNSDVIVGLDARGFIFGSLVAKLLNKPFVMIRKAGKLPGKTISRDYGLEYGRDVIEIQEGVIEKGQKVALIDDLLATGGTMNAACELVEKTGGKIDSVNFVMSLDDEYLVGMEARSELQKYEINSLVNY